MQRESQEAQILRHIDTEGSITSLEAFEHYRITRLAARIHDIERHGTVIEREMVYTDNADGHPIRYTRYRRAN